MPCTNEYVLVKDGCNIIRRRVYENDAGKKYIKNGGKNVMLSEIRGKYRYADKLVQN